MLSLTWRISCDFWTFSSTIVILKLSQAVQNFHLLEDNLKSSTPNNLKIKRPYILVVELCTAQSFLKVKTEEFFSLCMQCCRHVFKTDNKTVEIRNRV